MPERLPAGWYPDPEQPDASQRYWDGDAWTDQRVPISGLTRLTPRVVLAFAGAVAVIVAVFLPRLDLGMLDVPNNSLITSATEEAVAFIVMALAGFAAAYRDVESKRISWAPTILGALLVAFALYLGSGERIELERLDLELEVGPGSGVYALGFGGAALALAGLWGD